MSHFYSLVFYALYFIYTGVSDALSFCRFKTQSRKDRGCSSLNSNSKGAAKKSNYELWATFELDFFLFSWTKKQCCPWNSNLRVWGEQRRGSICSFLFVAEIVTILGETMTSFYCEIYWPLGRKRTRTNLARNCMLLTRYRLEWHLWFNWNLINNNC